MDKPFDKTNTGTLSKRPVEEITEDWHKPYKGKLNVEGREFWLDGEVKEGPYGKFFSLKVRPKQPKPDDYVRGSQDAISAQIRDELDDEIPF